MIEVDVMPGLVVRHGGSPPYAARSASDRTEDWPFWFVAGADGINRMAFPAKPGAVFTCRSNAVAIAAALNKASR